MRKWKSGCITSCICPASEQNTCMTHMHAGTTPPCAGGKLSGQCGQLIPRHHPSLPRTHFMHLHCKKVECVKCACGHRGGAGYCSCCTDTGMCFAGFACVQREELEACCTPLSRLNSSKASTSLNTFVSNCIKPNYSAPPGNHGQQSCNEQLHLKKLNGFSFTVG